MNTFAKKVLFILTVGSTVIGAYLYQSRLSVLQDSYVESPRKLSLTRWKEVLKETFSALLNKQLTTQAAALAYYGTFAFFPTLVAFISIFSLVISAEQLTGAIAAIETYLPSGIATVLSTQLQSLNEQPQASIVAAIVSISVALFGASTGIQNLIQSLNYTYCVDESRSYIKRRLLSIIFVLGGYIVALPILGLLVLQSTFLLEYGAPEWSVTAVAILRWIVVIVILSLALSVIYRYGPNRLDAKWQWVSWGALAATVLWAIGSGFFFYYLQNFASFESSYGLFAGIIAFMLWLNVSSLILLLGAEVNHRLEHQTNAVTTV